MPRYFHVAALAAGLAIAFFPPAANANDVVRIGWMRTPNDITLAKAHGSLEKTLKSEGADVSWVGPFSSAAPAFEALNANAIDITVGSSTSAISALAAHLPFVIFAYQKMSPASQGILVKRGSPIRTLADLRGKSVAVNRGGTGEYLLMQALATHHIDPTSVKRVYLSPPDSAAAFATDHVDAWATWDPFIVLAQKSYDAEILADGDAIGSDNAVVLIASRQIAENKPALLKAIYETIERENTWSLAHKKEAGAIWAETMGLSQDLGDTLGINNAVPTHAVTATDERQISDIADWYLSQGIVAHKPDIAAGVLELKD